MSEQIDTLYICDWLPPDFGAVGQYSVIFARELAAEGKKCCAWWPFVARTRGGRRALRERPSEDHQACGRAI